MNKAATLKFASAFLITLFALTFSLVSQAADTNPTARILVSGEGSVNLAPDMAILMLSVTRQAETARAALDANSLAMREVQAAMKTAGIEARDLQTSGFSIQPNYFYPPQKSSGQREPARIVGYTVRNSLTVRVRDISSVGAILDKSVSLGVNEGGNITFSNEDPSEAITQARVKAMKQAIDKATTLAQAAGVRTGKLLEITEQSHSPRPMPMARAAMAMGRSDESVPVATGENSYKVMVNVSFAIEQ